MKYPAGGSSLYSSSLCSQSNVEVAVHDLSSRRACPEKIVVTFALLPDAGNDPIARWKHTAARKTDTNRNAFDVFSNKRIVDGYVQSRFCVLNHLLSSCHIYQIPAGSLGMSMIITNDYCIRFFQNKIFNHLLGSSFYLRMLIHTALYV